MTLCYDLLHDRAGEMPPKGYHLLNPAAFSLASEQSDEGESMIVEPLQTKIQVKRDL